MRGLIDLLLYLDNALIGQGLARRKRQFCEAPTFFENIETEVIKDLTWARILLRFAIVHPKRGSSSPYMAVLPNQVNYECVFDPLTLYPTTEHQVRHPSLIS